MLAIWVGKLIYSLTRFLKLGGGSSAPGFFALKIDKDLLPKITRSIPETVLITGTNGKTTTAGLLSHFARANGLKVIHNTHGSNMHQGILSTLIEHSDLRGRVDAELAVWEVDEASFNKLVFKLKPKIIVFLNAARDQLDRYGELDSLIREWKESLSKIDFDPLILVNGDDGNLQKLMDVKGLSFETFGADKKIVEWEKDTPLRKIKSDFLASDIKENSLTSLDFNLTYKDGVGKVKLPLGGVYNAYNFLASFAAFYHLNLPIKTALSSVKSYKSAFGRIEKIDLKGKEGYILLIKNPNGTNQTLETIVPKLRGEDRVLAVLNDNLADGRDVSWVWDAEFEKLPKWIKTTCSGKRAEDLALRLKYAGADPKFLMVEPDLKKALYLSQKDLKGKLYILPTYTALLRLQNILAKSGIKKHYWEDN